MDPQGVPEASKGERLWGKGERASVRDYREGYALRVIYVSIGMTRDSGSRRKSWIFRSLGHQGSKFILLPV